MNDIELLRQVLSTKRPIIVLGAGFALGARNNKNCFLPNGKSLATILYNRMYEKCGDIEAKENLDGAFQYKEDLRRICSLIRSEGLHRLSKRNDILTETFSGCDTDQKHYQYFTEYPWDKIFSLNIDDFVEKLFRKSRLNLLVWNNESHGQTKNADPILIKLHGCVNTINKEYVFDDTEYQSFTANDNCLLREFADACIKRDVIFVGTEYQEDDLKTMLASYRIAGYKQETHYFFITPNINDFVLKTEIRKNPKYHWINWKTEDFLNDLHSFVEPANDSAILLKEYGMLDISDINCKGKSYYQSQLYTGKQSRYADFWQGWDIVYPKSVEWIKQIKAEKKHQLVSIYGKAYVGKTCVARHILVELAKNNYICRELLIDSSQKGELFREYLQSLPQDSSVALLCENAAFSYSILCSLIKRVPQNIKKLIILTVDNSVNHNRKKYDLDYSTVSEYVVQEKIDHEYSLSIISKLKEKSWTGKLPMYCTYESDYPKFARKVNDIIEFLYKITNGRGFEDYCRDFCRERNNNDCRYFFSAMIFLGKLGITYVPVHIFAKMLPHITTQFKYDKFISDYGEWVEQEGGNIHVRCLRLFENSVVPLASNDISELLFQISAQTVNLFDEESQNKWHELFQKALSVKKIIKTQWTKTQELEMLFSRLESICSNYSYYWIQRGILAQDSNNFEAAENYLLQAKKIRPKSYQVKHAIAKNYMERGIYEAKNNSQYASYYFEEGYDKMTELVLDSAYSKAYSYSTHALVDMKLKYAQIQNNDLDYQTCSVLTSFIRQATIDKMMYEIAAKLSSYLSKMKYNDIYEDLQRYLSTYISIEDESDRYDTEYMY